MTKAFALLIPLLAPFLFAETRAAQTNPCLDPHQKEFDFWVGKWDLTWPGEKPGEIAHGTNNIRRTLDGCVIHEDFSGGDSIHMRGTSVSTGGYLDFVGDFSNGQMILQREAVRNGEKILQRMVWKNISANELDWSWESSADGGKTWQVNWPIHYKRMR